MKAILVCTHCSQRAEMKPVSPVVRWIARTGLPYIVIKRRNLQGGRHDAAHS